MVVLNLNYFVWWIQLTLIGKFTGHELDQFMENWSNQNLWVAIQFCPNSGYETGFWKTQSPVMPRKTEIPENVCMSYSRFANKD